MKALLVNIDLMVRVIVPNNATDEEITTATIDKAQILSNDRSWFGEGITNWANDEVMPYGASPTDEIPESKPEFMDLAKHLVELMVESESDRETAIDNAMEEIDIESIPDNVRNKIMDELCTTKGIPECNVRLTALALQEGYENKEFEKTDGAYYYCGMIDDYGKYIDDAMQYQAKEMLKKVLG